MNIDEDLAEVFDDPDGLAVDIILKVPNSTDTIRAIFIVDFELAGSELSSSEVKVKVRNADTAKMKRGTLILYDSIKYRVSRLESPRSGVTTVLLHKDKGRD